MDKNLIVEWLVKNHFVENYIKKLENWKVDYKEDIIQEIYLMILEISDDKINELNKQGKTSLLKYIAGLIYRQVHSNNSYIYKKYKEQFKYEERMTPEEWQIFDEINKWLKNLNFDNE